MKNLPLIDSFNDIEYKIPIPSLQQFASELIKVKNEVGDEYFELYCQTKEEIINLLDAAAKSEVRDFLLNDFYHFLQHAAEGNVLVKEIKDINTRLVTILDLNNIKVKINNPGLRLHLIKKNAHKVFTRLHKFFG